MRVTQGHGESLPRAVPGRLWGPSMCVGSTFPPPHKVNQSHVRHKQESKWARSSSKTQTLGTRVTFPATPWALRDPLKDAGTVPPIGSRKGSVTTALWEDWPRPRGALPQSCHRAPGLGKQGDRPVRRTSPTGDSVSICIRYSLLTASATPRTQTQV